MKHGYVLLSLIIPGIILTECEICILPKWENLEQQSNKSHQFGTQLLLVGEITFRKRCKNCIKLDKLILKWHGKNIETLCGSLYKKKSKQFMPIEEQLVCDGTWNKRNQQLVLNFSNKMQTLGAADTFYLVLSIADDTAKIIKDGHFELINSGLPSPFDQYVEKHNLKLALSS